MDQEDLTTVHTAMQDAMVEDIHPTTINQRDVVKVVIATFRVPQWVKERADAICQGNGTNLSSFLRQCCEGLVRDYGGKQSE